MQDQKLLAFTQFSKLNRNNQSMQSLHHDDTVTKSSAVMLGQSDRTIVQTFLNWESLVKQFKGIGQALVRFTETFHEPKITWRRDRHGELSIEVYDPITEQHYYFDSSQDVLVWLDHTRYHGGDKGNY